MPSDNEVIESGLRRRARYQLRARANRTASDRLADFARLQEASFRVMRASPRGYRHFLARNLSARRVEVVDGVWKPVSSARCAQQAYRFVSLRWLRIMKAAANRPRDQIDLDNLPLDS